MTFHTKKRGNGQAINPIMIISESGDKPVD
jgi:hypothetical protein